MLIIPLDQPQIPTYNFDVNASKGIIPQYEYNEYNEIIFTVEAGTGFFLKLALFANPLPFKFSFQRVSQQYPIPTLDGTVEFGLEFVRIHSAQHSHKGRYTISCSNSVGDGQFSFQLQVQGMYRQLKSVPLVHIHQYVCRNPWL